MLRFIVACSVLAVTLTATTTPNPIELLYDLSHHTCMLVNPGDGCYEYHLSNTEVDEVRDLTTRPTFESRIIFAFMNVDPNNVHHIGHNHINHLDQLIVRRCASLEVYRWSF